MQCKIAQRSPNPDVSDMAWSQSPVAQQSNDTLLPHQEGSVDSCSSWPGRVWRPEPSKYWMDFDLNNNNNNIQPRKGVMRVSCSSESSYSSSDDISMSDCNEDSDNNNSEDSSSSSSSSSSITTTTTYPSKSCLKEDQNNNIDPDSNNNNNNNNTIDAESNTNNGNNWKKTGKKNDNPARERLLDDEGYIRRAACVCLDETGSKVLLVSSKKDPCSWLVPGGGMEAGEEMATAAIREAWEEAGVQGHITKYLGLFETTHQKGHKKHRTAVFVVSVKQVMADYPEAYLGRGRQWFTLEDALLHLARTRPLQSSYLQLLLVSRLKVTAT